MRRQPERAYEDILTDSRIWEQFPARDGDIVVSTPAKSGTTWMQGILSLLIHGDPEVDANPAVNAPWFDNKYRDLDEKLATLNAQNHCRHVKTHTALDGFVIAPQMRFITVYRHPIDVHFSARKHVANYRPDIKDAMGVAQLFPEDPSASFALFLTETYHDHASLWAVLNHYKATLRLEAELPLLRLHYADMLRDLSGVMAQVAEFIDVSHPAPVMDALVTAAQFDQMKDNADRFGPSAGNGFWQSDAGFFNSGTCGKWHGVLTDGDLAAYDAAISQQLSSEQRAWLEWGRPA